MEWNVQMNKNRYILIITILFTLLLNSCNVTKYVPEGKYLLDNVKITTDNKDLKDTDFSIYLRQQPNLKLFNFIPFNLGLYSISSPDTTLWINRFLQKIGDAPVIYDSTLVESSAIELKKAMNNKGYIHADVLHHTTYKKKKAKVKYEIISNQPYRIKDIKYRIRNEEIEDIILKDTINSLIKRGNLFDIDILEKERKRIAELLRSEGYFYFDKEYIGFAADTTIGNKQVKLDMMVRPMRNLVGQNTFVNIEHEKYYVNDINFYVVDNVMSLSNDSVVKSLEHEKYKNINIYSNNNFVRKKTLHNFTSINNNSLYNEKIVDQTYAKLAGLKIFKYLNISFKEIEDSIKVIENAVQQDSLLYGIETSSTNDTIRIKQLDCNITLTPDKLQSFSFELEGTNNEGDLGIAGKLQYGHNNIFKGGEQLKFQVRGANESIIGNRSIWEVSTEASISFPTILFPFLTKKFAIENNSKTEFHINYSYQIRDEYSRMIAGLGMRYNWQTKQRINHSVSLIDLNYVYLPFISDNFKKTINNSLLKYSYEDHFIMSAGYGISFSNKRSESLYNFYNVRTSAEIAGNLLYGICYGAKANTDANGSYLLGNIPFAQYAKVDFDFSYTHLVDKKNSLVYHVGLGVGVPYLNSTILPFEKRYYGGGANSVRGWSARSLGPGSYNAGSTIDYMKQSGDIKLDLNLEYRTKLVWLLELAAFIDAGNIWTLKDEGQVGGQFKFNQFYEQIALGYGIGIRLNFDYFVLRLDWGLKAFDPSRGDGERWRFVPGWHILKDTALHFAVGYPF